MDHRHPHPGAPASASTPGPSGETVPGAGLDAPRLVVLGRAQDGGLPHLGCRRPCCLHARREGRIELPACLGLIGPGDRTLHLVEATPAIVEQVERLQELACGRPSDGPLLDGILLTHAHIGHYLGLAQLGREVAGTSRLPLHVSPRVAGLLRTNQPWGQLVELEQVLLECFEPGGSLSLIPGVVVEPVPVPHRDEFFDTMALRFRGPEHSVLFLPDIDSWDAPGLPAGFLEGLVDEVDVAYLDGTFYDGRELPPGRIRSIPHPPMVDTMDRLSERARARPGAIRFIHLNHNNPALHEPDLRRRIEDRGFRLAEPHEVVGL